MKNLKIAIASLITTGVLTSGSALAAIGTLDENGAYTNAADIHESDEVTLSFNHPQSLAVSAPNNVTERSSGGIISRKWTVVSNNAVKVKMTGKSPDATGTETNTPVFYKQEVDNQGAVIASRFDQLVTTYGATIDGHNDVQTGTTFGGGAQLDANGGVKNGQNPGTDKDTTPAQDYSSVLTGSPTQLVGTTFTNAFGSIMPSDDGRFTLTLSAKGIGDVATTQSGDYQVTIVASFIANEQGNNLVAASAPNTSLLSDIDTYTKGTADGQITTTEVDNTNWNNTADGSTGVDGTDQNPDDIQTDAGLSASNLDYYTAATE